MALFIFIILMFINSFARLLGSESNSNTSLEITPTSVTGGQNVGYYKVEDTLNLTCTFKKEEYSNVILDWHAPTRASNRQNRVIQKRVSNLIILTIENLQENDSGDYKCEAVHNGVPYFKVETTVRISVKNKKKECADVMFQCSPGICIPKRFTCDGQRDCPNGEDESPINCGPGNPCVKKIICPDKRCIPFTWCCELHKEPNCTTKIKPECCAHVEKLTRDVENDFGYQYEQQRFSDMGFLQTTVYTVIGCAMAFMFIVTIIVIAICRVHVRRTLLSRCPATNRNIAFGRNGNINSNQLNGLSFYDLDLYLNRSGLNGNDLMSVNPLLVTYNINNGVQFVGRPVDPPPYCEIVTSPPKEGPPPPYVSHEDLTQARCVENQQDAPKPEPEEEHLDVELEVTESDALLGATSQAAPISIISCNAIDVVSPPEECTKPGSSDEATTNCRKPEDSKESSEIFVNCDSSQCSEVPAAKSAGETSKNLGLDIVVLTGCDSVLTESQDGLKVQNGESSSYVSGVEVGDMSVKKIVSVNSMENGSFKRKTKSFSKGHFKKF